MIDTLLLAIVEHSSQITIAHVLVGLLLLCTFSYATSQRIKKLQSFCAVSGTLLLVSMFCIVYLVAFENSERVAWLVVSTSKPTTAAPYVRFASRFPGSSNAEAATNKARELQRHAIEANLLNLRGRIFALLYSQPLLPPRLTLVVKFLPTQPPYDRRPREFRDVDRLLRSVAGSELGNFGVEIRAEEAPFSGVPALGMRYWVESGRTYSTLTTGGGAPPSVGTTRVPRLVVQLDLIDEDGTFLHRSAVSGEGQLENVRAQGISFSEAAIDIVLAELYQSFHEAPVNPVENQ